ncbi:MAG: acyltransferase [Bacteroidetes bacterium CG02_land_8_20_14_3_00_31_25]|nr:acyltransferase [Bacteroidota bacterium]PIV57946.1 MAG: acyltransferase [Bacteroidetes bacterium CG02_land_8_20_14_3_00_31_25]PIX36195.1 MAG: acyltransferase [Bacteroidetes bacterium CG_4_8_14_3_um_filter_31_14]PIY07276.1 MAG: acyltransferase [Bacteroidetes bacterium CG_4_10_14_3_um_filter_31_20]
MYKKDFEEIRPFYDSEINAVLKKLINNPFFQQVLNGYFPKEKHQEIIKQLNNTNSAFEFQRTFMYQIIDNVIAITSNGITTSGIEKISKEKQYLFISNHRDIILDSAILQKVLFENNIPTTEIAFGSNLMDVPLIAELGRANKMFIVKRGGNLREVLHNSNILSAYIRHAILEKKTSVWLAQRNGRTKDGNDKTEIALLKMLNLSGKKSVAENIAELNIVPVTISYEFETCDAEKAKEVYNSKDSKYEKKIGEDTSSVIKGITNYKGQIHLAFGNPVLLKNINTFSKDSNADFFKGLGQYIDNEITTNYKLHINNYIAYDLINNSNKFFSNYSETEKTKFINYKNSAIGDSSEDLNKIFLEIYANPILNKLNLKNN